MTTKKPNVVICICDQLRAMDVGCYGGSFVKTPNMDALAEQGVRFDIACSNNPVCTAARSALLTGQYSRTCAGSLVNAPDPERERSRLPDTTIAEAFRSAGYRTGLIGKWHVWTHPGSVGFDWVYYPNHMHRYTGQTFYDSDGASSLVEGFSFEAEQAELKRFLAVEDDRPFFLYYNISQPHMPLDDMPERYKRMYSPADVPLRPNVFEDGKPAYDERWFAIYLWDYLFYLEHLPHTEKLPTPPPCPSPWETQGRFDLRHLTALYYGAVTWADDQLGELMRQLAEAGLDENTIVIFTSDHGDNLGSHQLFNKDQLYEESIRIPMIYRWPGGLSPREVDTQVTSLVDVMPTALSLAAVDIPESVQGTDVSEVVLGVKQATGENAAFIETTTAQVGMRTLTHLYGVKKAMESDRTTTVIDDRFMFFDLVRDPLQTNNLAASSDSDPTASSLRERLLEWDRETKWL